MSLKENILEDSLDIGVSYFFFHQKESYLTMLMSLEAIYKENKSKQLLPGRCFETVFPHIKLITLVEKITCILR